MEQDFKRAAALAEARGFSAPAPGVFILSDVRLYREGLSASLGRTPALTVLGAAPPAEADLASIAAGQVAILLLDATMEAGLRLLRRLKLEAPHVKVVAVCVSEDENEQLAYVEAGVAGYVTREGSIDDVVAAAQRCLRGEVTCSDRLAARLFERVATLSRDAGEPIDAPSLTPRERDIVDLIDRGLSNKEIARSLKIGLPTVKNHVHRVLEKLNVRRRGEAAAWARIHRPTGRAFAPELYAGR
ncbi:LuxR C-terminal-related transcriptional regulator [Phenylobacterium immobile]|uniref:LuxR C-terminal-related transcriptional regulator n=1 Tax=Phenylobacterium immobile TaxID=21 RepID=UPI000A4AAC6E|nr:response regulator transcription factor [Phenylobacterium immobile]